MSDHHEPATASQDPIEAITPMIPMGGLLIFLLAFIAVAMA